MRKLFVTIAVLFAMLAVSSCATDGVVVYRDYQTIPYWYSQHDYYVYRYGPTYYHYYYYPRHHHKPHHHFSNPPKPHNQQPVAPRPAPKATVRHNNSVNNGSMSGARPSDPNPSPSAGRTSPRTSNGSTVRSGSSPSNRSSSGSGTRSGNTGRR